MTGKLSAEGERGRQPIPAKQLLGALVEARKGIMPVLDESTVLHMLRLDGDEPDGLTMLDRLTDQQLNPMHYFPVVRFAHAAEELIGLTNDRRANPAQETMASILGSAVTHQVRREGDICDGARDLALFSTRPDIIPPDVRLSLLAPQIAAALHNRFLGQADFPSGAAVFIIRTTEQPGFPEQL